jgi:hypothetical protein
MIVADIFERPQRQNIQAAISVWRVQTVPKEKGLASIKMETSPL